MTEYFAHVSWMNQHNRLVAQDMMWEYFGKKYVDKSLLVIDEL